MKTFVALFPDRAQFSVACSTAKMTLNAPIKFWTVNVWAKRHTESHCTQK